MLVQESFYDPSSGCFFCEASKTGVRDSVNISAWALFEAFKNGSIQDLPVVFVLHVSETHFVALLNPSHRDFLERCCGVNKTNHMVSERQLPEVLEGNLLYSLRLTALKKLLLSRCSEVRRFSVTAQGIAYSPVCF